MLYFLRLSTLSDFDILMKSMIDHIINNNPKIQGLSLIHISNNTNNSSNANVGVLRDLSVNLEKNYSVPDSDSNVLELASTPDELYQNDLKKLISISDDLIRLTVQNVAYTSYEGCLLYTSRCV